MKRKTSVKPYSKSRVAVEKSQAEISRLLERYGALGVQFTREFDQKRVMLRFAKRIQGNPRTVTVCMDIKMGQRTKPEQAERSAYRAVYYWLKAQFEAIEFGIVSFEDAFLAHFEWMLPNGQTTTVGKMVAPQISNKANAPKLLVGEIAIVDPNKKAHDGGG